MKWLARPPAPGLVLLLVLALLGLQLALLGIGRSPDSFTYALWADRLIDARFDYPAAIRAYGDPVAATYSLFVTLVALLKLGLGSAWAPALVALNVAAMAAVALLVVRLAARITGRGEAGWAALFLFLGCFDAWQWSRYLLSDSIFLLFAYAVFLMEARRLLGRSQAWGRVFAAASVACFFRPTGIVLLPLTAWSLLLAATPATVRLRRVMLACLCGAGLLAILLFGWVMQDPDRWPVGAGEAKIRAVAADYAQGQVVWGRPSTDRPPPATIADHWAISAARFVHFFSPGPEEYSARHMAAQYAFWLPAWIGFAWFVLLLLAGRSGLDRSARDVCLAALGAILLYAFFHAMLQVDHGWRYRLPIMPHIIFLAAAGLADLYARLGRLIPAIAGGGRTS
jgi:4-amino-4-deoxy-L-arabinose transferase-like glycosyltransferase